MTKGCPSKDEMGEKGKRWKESSIMFNLRQENTANLCFNVWHILNIFCEPKTIVFITIYTYFIRYYTNAADPSGSNGNSVSIFLSNFLFSKGINMFSVYAS